MQLRLAHRSLEPEQQAVVEVGGVVDAVLVEDQRVGQRADLEQPVPVGGVARQARDLQPEHDSGASHAHLGHQLLKPRAVHRRGARLTEIGVDDDDLLTRPPERYRALAEAVLALGALGVLEHLPYGRLPYIEVGAARQVTGADLPVRFVAHRPILPSPSFDIAMLASTRTTLA